MILFFFNLPLFAIFLTLTYGLISIVDSAIDKYIITTSPDKKTENKSILVFQIGAVVGSIITSALFIIIGSWMLLFISNILISLPLIFIIFRLQEPTGEFSISKTSLREDLSKALQSKPLLIMCVFLFLYSASYLFDWVLEPWIDATYSGGANLYFLFIIIWIFLNIFGLYLGPKLSAKYSEVKISLVLMIICGVIYIIAPFLDLLIMLILFSIVQVFAGIITMCIISVIMGISEKKVVLYQVMSSIFIISRIIYTPLGLFLYTFLDGNVIIAITGAMFIISAIPLYFLEYKRQGE